jgi:tRNA (guanine37-N1)-methyltransferase
MLRLDVVTIFPRMLAAPLQEGIVSRAVERGLVALGVHDLRDYSDDRHRTVDDAPFGGGPGMVMKAEPFFRAVESILPDGPGPRDAVVLLSPRGTPFQQATAERFASMERLVLLCGRYEGIDERVGMVVTEEVSLGDFVLTGGEVAALAVAEATVRLVPGALGDEGSASADSFAAEGILDFPHFTRPALVRGRAVPDVLLSGDHGRIARWRRKQALSATRERRPDLLAAAHLSALDECLLRELELEARGENAEASLLKD